MNQSIKTLDNTIFIELTDGNAKKKSEDEKWFHRNGVERRNLFPDSGIFFPVDTEVWFDDR